MSLGETYLLVSTTDPMTLANSHALQDTGHPAVPLGGRICPRQVFISHHHGPHDLVHANLPASFASSGHFLVNLSMISDGINSKKPYIPVVFVVAHKL